MRACHLVGARGLNARSLHSIANRLLPSQAVADRGQLIAGMASQLLPVGKMMSRERTDHLHPCVHIPKPVQFAASMF